LEEKGEEKSSWLTRVQNKTSKGSQTNHKTKRQYGDDHERETRLLGSDRPKSGGMEKKLSQEGWGGDRGGGGEAKKRWVRMGVWGEGTVKIVRGGKKGGHPTGVTVRGGGGKGVKKGVGGTEMVQVGGWLG